MNAAQTLSFEGHGIRVLEQPQGRMVPIKDIADAVARDPESLRQLVTRDELLRDWSTTCITQAVDGRDREFRCLTEPGVVRLLGMLNPERSATPESRAKVLAFGRWAATTLVKVMRGESLAAPEATETWVSQYRASEALGIPKSTIRQRVVRYNIPVRREHQAVFVPLEILRANLEAHPIQAQQARVNASTSQRREVTLALMSELRRIYGPQGAQAVLHSMDPRLFPNPKTLPGGFQAPLEVVK